MYKVGTFTEPVLLHYVNNTYCKQAWAHEIFIFMTEKKFEISGHFSGHRSHKKRVFLVISGAYNFRTFRAEAKITMQRHEVVYRLSSEH